jgi:SlyX protein
MEERLIDLEIRITRQEDMIDELNKTVYQQQLKIDNLEAILKEMASRIVELENDNPLNEKPPHY